MTAPRKIARVFVAAAALSMLASPLLANAAAMSHHGKPASAAKHSKAPKQ